jgi:hypothetical protein
MTFIGYAQCQKTGKPNLIFQFHVLWTIVCLFFLDIFVPLCICLKVFTYSISYCKDNIKCDSVSNANKCPLNNGVFIVQNLVVKLPNTSTMLFPPVAKTLSKCLRVWQQVFERFICLVVALHK